MRAALFRRHGGPEVMEIGDVPTPTPGPGEVQIRVTAAALNHIDLWLRKGLPALPVPLPHVSGGDVCGVVSELGPGVAPRADCARQGPQGPGKAGRGLTERPTIGQRRWKFGYPAPVRLASHPPESRRLR
jgi:NADPH:quinone reductase-like Zn-dependent oxidoreductase